MTELHAGDLGAVAKLRETFTGDTLGQKGAEIRVETGGQARAEHDLCHRAEDAGR